MFSNRATLAELPPLKKIPAPSRYGHFGNPGHEFPRVESVKSVQLHNPVRVYQKVERRLELVKLFTKAMPSWSRQKPFPDPWARHRQQANYQPPDTGRSRQGQTGPRR